MAVQNVSSGIVADFDASPVVKHSPIDDGGVVREITGIVTLTATQAGGDATSVWRLVRLPTNARITSIVLDSDALAASALDVDLGFYLPNGGAAVSQTAIGDTVGPLTAAVVGKEMYALAGASYANDPVWTVAGVSADPAGFYDLALTVVVAGVTPAPGSVSVRVKYVVNA